MFDGSLPEPVALTKVDDGGLIDAIAGWARVAEAAEARKSAAIAELVRRRDTDEHAHWVCDDWDAAADEIAAALNISHGWASAQMTLAVTLRDRLPKVNELFLEGRLTARVVTAIAERTELVIDTEALAELDASIAEAAVRWGPMTKYKLTQAIDMWVQRVDPAAVIRAKDNARTRDFTVGDPNTDQSGTTSVWGRLLTTDAALLAQRLTQMIAAVCAHDPRTQGQRRADALGALAAGSTALGCQCGLTDCAASQIDDGRASSITVHLLADHSTALIPGRANSIIPAPLLTELITRGAKTKPLLVPTTAENRYRPSVALDTFIRLRDLTCRHPGCDRPAAHADLDHTVPYPAGATHPGNLKADCRHHHLRKTFWPGWTERQDPDGTVHVTTPTGHTYTTTPFGALLFPALRIHTPTPPPGPPAESSPHRTLKMPTRQRTRAQTRAQRIVTERARDHPPPF
jgi:uncharacterized protein DUF222